jgi:twitching motility protein PilT
MIIQEMFQQTVLRSASDLHIIPGYAPTIRILNELANLEGSIILTSDQTTEILESILSAENKEELHLNKELDFAYEFGEIRFRVNYYYTQKGLAGAFRTIPKKIKTLEELSMPSMLYKLAKAPQGLVLFTGPTGEGKSTTISALINDINLSQRKHIVTVEDPIEFIYPFGKSIISQREMHTNTHSWGKALQAILREDPDVVLIGEMRDLDTIQAALTIAETGHLVFSTLHTNSTPEAINRMIDVFPAHQQNQVRNQLSTVLNAVIYQRLIPNIKLLTRIPAVEILINTPAVSSLIREGKTFMIDNVLETGEEQNMIIFDKYLARLFKQNLISREDALSYAVRLKEFEKFML